MPTAPAAALWPPPHVRDDGSMRLTRILAGAGLLGALSLLASLALAPISLGEPRPHGEYVPRDDAFTPALAARTISLNETGHLRLTSKHNFTLNEQGSTLGTITAARRVRPLASTASSSPTVRSPRRSTFRSSTRSPCRAPCQASYWCSPQRWRSSRSQAIWPPRCRRRWHCGTD